MAAAEAFFARLLPYVISMRQKANARLFEAAAVFPKKARPSRPEGRATLL